MIAHTAIGFLESVTGLIRGILEKERRTSLTISIFLTGGRSARALYEFMALHGRDLLMSAKIYFGDERCVPESDPCSNLGMLRRQWRDIENCGCEVFGIRGDAPSPEMEALRYAGEMPETVNLVLLSVGEDGHIASLFPYDGALGESEREVVAISVAGITTGRVTITPRLLARAKNIVVMAVGARKGKVLAEAINQCGQDPLRYPVCLTRGGTWVLDQAAATAFLHHCKGCVDSVSILVTGD
jgi:6-phosphogluconolactonase